MTAVTLENPADDALYADEPEPEDTGSGEPGADTITAEAPYGYTRDKTTGLMRPKKAPGRPRAPRTPEELQDAPEPPPRPPDEAPTPGGRPLPPTDDDVPMPAGGTIAKKVNRLYRRVGRVLRRLDHDIGTAFIEVTRKEDADDITAGEAWENLCKDNPRIRSWVLNAIKGGAWQDLILAHAAIAMAIITKRWIMEHIPFMSMAAAWFERDDGDQADTGDGGGQPLEAADVAEMAGTGAAVMRRAGSNVTIQRMAAKLADGSASLDDLEHLDPELVAAAQAMAAKGIPPGFRRTQPKHRPRSKRRH